MTNQTELSNELFAALAKAQGQFKTVAASRHVIIKMKDGGSYSYNYATLASIMDMLRAPFANNGLSIAQLIVGDELITILAHSSGQSISSTVALPKSSDIKGVGANLTYLRRYSITAIAGVAIDEEDDEAVADGKVEAKARQLKPINNLSASPPIIIKTGDNKHNGNEGNSHTDKPYKFPSNAAKNFYDTVQSSTDQYYSNPPHLLQVIGGWFNFGSEDLWNEKLSAAVDHARQKREADKVEVETQVSQDEISF